MVRKVLIVSTLYRLIERTLDIEKLLPDEEKEFICSDCLLDVTLDMWL